MSLNACQPAWRLHQAARKLHEASPALQSIMPSLSQGQCRAEHSTCAGESLSQPPAKRRRDASPLRGPPIGAGQWNGHSRDDASLPLETAARDAGERGYARTAAA